MGWLNMIALEPRAWTCGYCTHKVAGHLGFPQEATRGPGRIYVCSYCDQPTYVDLYDRQWPGIAFGSRVDHVPEDVGALYDEARRCCSVSAYTSVTLACRKLLMSIAASQGADEGKTFAHYVDWLETSGYIPPNGKAWVDRIRKLGNEATHELATKTQQDAETAVAFTEMLLKSVFEFPAQAAASGTPPVP